MRIWANLIYPFIGCTDCIASGARGVFEVDSMQVVLYARALAQKDVDEIDSEFRSDIAQGRGRWPRVRAGKVWMRLTQLALLLIL